MTTRLLPRAEWPRLVGTELEHVWPWLTAEDSRILVAEQDGQIVGCWALIRYWHLEGAWVHPAHRQQGTVVRRGLVAMQREAQHVGAHAVLTSALDDAVRGWIARLGGQRLPGTHHVIPIGGGLLARGRIGARGHAAAGLPSGISVDGGR